jgi:hypothetical protein
MVGGISSSHLSTILTGNNQMTSYYPVKQQEVERRKTMFNISKINRNGKYWHCTLCHSTNVMGKRECPTCGASEVFFAFTVIGAVSASYMKPEFHQEFQVEGINYTTEMRGN